MLLLMTIGYSYGVMHLFVKNLCSYLKNSDQINKLNSYQSEKSHLPLSMKILTFTPGELITLKVNLEYKRFKDHNKTQICHN